MCSIASPKIWAELCQNTASPSGLSNFNNCSEQSPSNGRSKSHKTLFTFAMTVASAKPWLIVFAISYGVLCHAVPSTTLPSGSVTLIGTRGFNATSSSYFFFNLSHNSKRDLMYSGSGFVSFGADPPPAFFSFLDLFPYGKRSIKYGNVWKCKVEIENLNRMTTKLEHSLWYG